MLHDARHGADQCRVDLAAVLTPAKKGTQRRDDMLERVQARAPRLTLHEADDVRGTQRAEVNALVAEAIDDELAHARPVATGRAGGQAAVSQQELLEAGEQRVSGKRACRCRSAQPLVLQVAQELPQRGRLVAVRLAATVASRLIVAARELFDVRFAQVCEVDALLAEPGIECGGSPGLGAQADDGVTLFDQRRDECREVRR